MMIYGLLLIGLFMILMVLGVPIAFSLALSAIITVVTTGNFTVTAIIHRMIGNSSSYTLLAIPFFILAAKLMNTGGITRRIFRAASAWVGSIPGGLGHANVVASVIFSGMSGSAVADAGGLGQVEVDAMRKDGFDDDFSAAVTCASATIGPIIPPSIPAVVYGMMTEVSVGSLFIGGIIPGLLLAIACSVLVYYISVKRKYPVRKFSWKEVGASTADALLSLLTPVIIIGGIWTGIFSPTEAAAMATCYAFFLAVIVYREMSLKEVATAIEETVRDSAGILLIICGAAAFSWLVTMLGLTETFSNALTSLTDNKYVMLLILNIAFLIIGMFMEALATMTITIPFLIPLMNNFGIDPVHLGIVLILNLMIGLSTPPVGTSLFVCAKVANISIERMYKAILPFLVPLILVLFLITYVPGLVTWLPGMMLK
ncbi:MAG TPA: TRAP transporter large permease [Bacillota bacterium]|jgi:tripartite ATP-independent transporter DctM subunit|nr:TRAP transporter large permease [Bacillota bacterium]